MTSRKPPQDVLLMTRIGTGASTMPHRPANITCVFVAYVSVFFVHGSTALVGLDLLIVEVPRSHSDTPHSVGLPSTSDQSDADTST